MYEKDRKRRFTLHQNLETRDDEKQHFDLGKTFMKLSSVLATLYCWICPMYTTTSNKTDELTQKSSWQDVPKIPIAENNNECD